MTAHSYGRFTLFRKLPAGGMGRVFEADDPPNGRRVALKLIDHGSDTDSLQIIEAERLGAELQQRLCALDPRITAVYEFGDLPDYFYIVMEYVEGQDLSELSAQERIGPLFAARIAQDVLEVLHQAHNFRTNIEGREYRGIVHGDIKPRNIRLTTTGQVKVLDFGIAKALSMTRNFTQNIFGSVQYSSPERLNTGEVTISSDLWGVAVVLYEMIARRPYFAAESGPKLEYVIRNYSQRQPLPDDCPVPLRQILERALDPDAPVRYQAAADFAADLYAFRNDEIPAVYDNEATRRISRTPDENVPTAKTMPAVGNNPAREDVEATRRTHRNPPFAAHAPAKTGSAIPRAPGRRLRIGRLFLLGFLLFSAYVVYQVFSEYSVWRASHQLARDLDSEKLQRVDEAWQQYQTLAARANFGVSVWAAQDSLRNRLLALADRAINEYRTSDAPSVSEAEWTRARANAAHALELAPQDKTVRGKLRLIEGHLARIRGGARHDARLLQEARENFDSAAALLSKSPDPWLGLARLYVYSFHDVERAESALKEAERRGHDIGKRETAQLADGYRDRAERTLREGDRADTEAEASRYYDRARSDFERARKMYESIVPWGAAAANLRKTSDALDHMQQARSRGRED
ncbi:MAG TPA: serine/threonine-protein kinase [Bryobacteraceae bacterium]|nr:serine/threonine-protein kinase [Bryobacteraceae bacterium]